MADREGCIDSVPYDCIYDDGPLGFEKNNNTDTVKKVEVQDPLEEVDIGNSDYPRPTYVSKMLPDDFKKEMVEILKEYCDCFAWDYAEMPGLSRELNGKLRVCIDFRDLNSATPKDEYPMPIADILIDSTAVHEMLSFMDGYSGYNQIYIAEEDVSKTAFRCPEKGIEIDKNKAKAILEAPPPTNKKQLQAFLGKVNYLRRFISNLSGKTKVFAPLIKLKKEEEFQWKTEHEEAFDNIKQYLTNPHIMTPPRHGAPLKLYVSASEVTIGGMLAQEDENGNERVIYYLSRVLNDVESRYSPIEKLCLTLYFSCLKLKYYLIPRNVYVISKFDVLKYMLSFPILHGRLGKWMLALTEFSLHFIPARAIKGQVLADFLVDHPCIDIDENLLSFVGFVPWKLYFDGSCHKGGVGIGILIISPSGEPSKFLFELNYSCSNNVAEYEALIMGLELLLERGVKNVKIFGDSQLVVCQVSLEHRCVSENLRKYFNVATELLSKFDSVIVRHVPRELNQEANELAQIASRYKIKPATLEKLKSVDGNLLTCLGEKEAYLALAEVHEGICGAHQSGKKMKWVINRKRLYWPTIQRDCINYARSCEECQKHGSLQHIPALELHVIIKPWPFREAIPLREVTYNEIIDFIEEHIMHRFGIPQSITTDQGTMFIGKKVMEYAKSRDDERLRALERVIQQKEIMSKSYNCRVKAKTFAVGDLV
ncbi:uncharacterized protein LOC107494047 [Arachis duranensis]|uniref:Uncharacterized protein LOC107494047 n=1 Tax=Arachis duranensis TaxID=130453 RepID=A0A6P4DX61_ARADU|nr:uncharacterized protein LOC107494047 [Arachis duranensis]